VLSCPTELDFVDVFRQAASYVDRTCGDEPAELPVQLATKFETVLTLKRPKRSLTMPPGLLVAGEVGEARDDRRHASRGRRGQVTAG
jgi:hypothetical protein